MFALHCQRWLLCTTYRSKIIDHFLHRMILTEVQSGPQSHHRHYWYYNFHLMSNKADYWHIEPRRDLPTSQHYQPRQCGQCPMIMNIEMTIYLDTFAWAPQSLQEPRLDWSNSPDTVVHFSCCERTSSARRERCNFKCWNRESESKGSHQSRMSMYGLHMYIFTMDIKEEENLSSYF